MLDADAGCRSDLHTSGSTASVEAELGHRPSLEAVIEYEKIKTVFLL